MIINRVWAENVLKYAHLDINRIPTTGLIAISGPNESGKSSIGETICFALFGRTFSLDYGEVAKIIRWGAPSCAASIDFSVHGKDYQVSRFVDEQGKHGARLDLTGGDEPLARGVGGVRQELNRLLKFGFPEFIESFYLAQREITAPHPHSAAVKRMAGISPLEQISNTLQWEDERHASASAETRELRGRMQTLIDDLDVRPETLPTIDRERRALAADQKAQVDRAANLDLNTLRYTELIPKVKEALGAVVECDANTSLTEWRRRLSHMNECIEEASHHPQATEGTTTLTGDLELFAKRSGQRLGQIAPLLEQAQAYRRQLVDLLENRQRGSDDVGAKVSSFAQRYARIDVERRQVKKSGLKAASVAFLLLLVAVVAWGSWWLTTQMPEHDLTRRLTAAAGQWIPQWEASVRPWLVQGAAAVTGLAALFSLFALGSRLRASALARARTVIKDDENQAKADVASLEHIERAPLSKALESIQALRDEGLGRAVAETTQGPGGDFVDTERLERYRDEARGLARSFETQASEERERLAQESGRVKDELERSNASLSKMEASIEKEKDRQRRDRELRKLSGDFQVKIEGRERHSRIRTTARSLLAGSITHMAQEFNREVRGLVGKTLPLLTQDRYQHMQIDEDLNVRVFSSEKHDFMDLEEISSGTQRQIMLAVRLALSQELVNTAHGGSQFAFLDEPFAFFDEPRTRASLATLPELSNEITQFWIVAQQFPDDAGFDMHIRCDRERDAIEAQT